MPITDDQFKDYAKAVAQDIKELKNRPTSENNNEVVLTDSGGEIVSKINAQESKIDSKNLPDAPLNFYEDAQRNGFEGTEADLWNVILSRSSIISEKKVSNLVIIGDSMVERPFGRSLTEVDVDATNAFISEGLDINVYGYGFSGQGIQTITNELPNIFTAFPDDTHFHVMIGINNVNTLRPYDQNTTTEQRAQITNDYENLFLALESRKENVTVSNLHFVNFETPASFFDYELLGSKPFNDNILNPLISANLPNTINEDGNPIVDTYNYSRNNWEIMLIQNEGLHWSVPAGENLFTIFLINRLKGFLYTNIPTPMVITPLEPNPLIADPNNESNIITVSSSVSPNESTTAILRLVDENNELLVVGGDNVSFSITGSAVLSDVTDNNNGSYSVSISNNIEEEVVLSATVNEITIPSQATIRFETVVDSTDAIIAFGDENNGAGFNNINLSESQSNEPKPILDLNGFDTNATVRCVSSGTNNFSQVIGISFGADTFDNTLSNTPIYSSYVAIRSGNTMNIIFEGLESNKTYPFKICGSSPSGTARTTTFSSGGVSVDVFTSENPPNEPVDIIFTSDENGVINVTMSSPDFGYISGIMIDL